MVKASTSVSWIIGGVGIFLIGFSACRALVRWAPNQFGEDAVYLSGVVIGATLIGVGCAALVSHRLGRAVLFVACTVSMFFVLFYLPYCFPYSGSEPEYQRLSPLFLSAYLLVLNYGLFVVGALFAFAGARGVRNHLTNR